jgi:site-specific recombinase XerD
MPTTWSAQKIHFLTQPELRALFRVITRRRDRALFRVAYRHGLRASEVGLLQVDDLNFAQQRLTGRRLKRSLPGVYHLRADEVTTLKASLRGRQDHAPGLFLSQRGTPISRRQLDTLMKHYGALADIPASKRHFHVLKHSIATRLLDAGADLRFVQDWVGHASIKNMVIYAQLTSRLRDEEAPRVFASPYVV